MEKTLEEKMLDLRDWLIDKYGQESKFSLSVVLDDETYYVNDVKNVVKFPFRMRLHV